MGRIAAQLADVVIATSDNPRTEDPEFILSEVEAGVLPALHGNFHEKITDRRTAIFRAIELAQKMISYLLRVKVMKIIRF